MNMKERCTICSRMDDPEDYIDSPIKRLMIVHQCCFHCAYWFNRPKENIKADLVPVIVNRDHWSYRKGENIIYAKVSSNRSAAVGNFRYILFEDGSVTVVSQLRYQGKIPYYFKDLLPNNAVFIEESDYDQILALQDNKNIPVNSAICPQPLLNFLLEKYHFTK